MQFAQIFALLLLAAPAASAPAATPVPLAPFHSVALHSGGEVVVRYGPVHRVELVTGDLSETEIAVREGRLVIHNCPRRCADGHRLRVAIVMPRLDSASVESGGRIRVEPGFPAQAGIAAEVNHGGLLDIRALGAARVTAAVAQGGMIFTRPGERLDARVSHGGIVTYWGEPAVARSVEGGGVIARGRPEDEERPLAELAPKPQRLAPIPPIPPVPAFIG